MIDAKDLEVIKKISADLTALGYSEPRVSILGATGETSNIAISFSKDVSQSHKDDC